MKFTSYKEKIKIKDLVGKNYSEYYESVFKKFDVEGKSKILNIPALIFTPYWYIYRKMVSKGALIICLQIILAMTAYTLKNPIIWGLYALSFLYYVYSGFYGNYEYYKKIQKLKSEGDEVDVKFRHKFVNDKSGVDLTILICWIVGTIILYFVALFT